MSLSGGPARPRPRRPARRRRPWRLLLLLPLAVILFALGLAVGEALHDNPAPGLRTESRELRPVTLPPERVTVTVTTTVTR